MISQYRITPELVLLVKTAKTTRPRWSSFPKSAT